MEVTMRIRLGLSLIAFSAGRARVTGKGFEMHSRASRTIFIALFAVAALFGSARVARAATISVDCGANSSALASALTAASDGDTVAIQGTCQGLFDISKSLTLTGIGGATLDGQALGTVVTIESGKTVAINSLRVTGGRGTSGSFAFVGGIFNNGSVVTITNTAVAGNNASVGQFRNGVGGIFNLGGQLAIKDSTISGNGTNASAASSTAVGGIFNLFGVVTIERSTLSGNSASGTPSQAFGGILNSSPGSVVTLTNSTVSGNTADAPAGGFSTAVGGISNSGGSLTLMNSTLVGNGATEANGGQNPPTGGVTNLFGGTLSLSGTIVAAQVAGPNCFGLAAASDAGYNLEDGTSCAFSTATQSLSNTQPRLDPAGLADNGGPTKTIGLAPGSPAVDAIPAGSSGCGTTITVDQRGVQRPQGTRCDIGAYELVLARSVAIDIKPGSPTNPINLSSSGTIPVAILSTSSFSAPSEVDTASLRFGRTGDEASLAFCSTPQDVNADGRLDLLCHFSTSRTGLAPTDTQAVLTGRTTSGVAIRGTDGVVIVPPQ